ncbi:MAG: flagellar motor switch protein FliG [Myxococcales bacterium]|nr:MAG: flagellar motor switch protein FliG [Myxococcales bacterium]
MPALTHAQKAVLVLVSIGSDSASGIVRQLANREIKKISSTVSSIASVTPEEVMEVLEEFLTTVSGETGYLASGEEWIRNVVEKALGSSKASHLLRDMGPPQQVFDSLFDIDLNSLANLIRKEHPQTQSLILAHLDPAKAAGVLALLSEEQQVDIVLRIAQIQSIHPDLLVEIESALMAELQMMGTLTTAEAGGVDMVVDMLNIMEKKTEKMILEGMEQENPKLAEEIKAMMFVFEDLVRLDDRSLQMILREIDSSTLVMALRGANQDMKNKVFANVSTRAAQMLAEDIDALGPVRLRDVENAQSEITRVALRLEEEGKIAISSSGEEEFV